MNMPLQTFARALPTEEIPFPTLVVELVIAALLLAFMFIFRKRFLKILCACGAEVCLWLACKMAFGEEALLSQIMTWLTALAAIILTISIVNRIHWGNLRASESPANQASGTSRANGRAENNQKDTTGADHHSSDLNDANVRDTVSETTNITGA